MVQAGSGQSMVQHQPLLSLPTNCTPKISFNTSSPTVPCAAPLWLRSITIGDVDRRHVLSLAKLRGSSHRDLQLILSSLYPQDEHGLPAISDTGQYHVKTFYNGAYRRVSHTDLRLLTCTHVHWLGRSVSCTRDSSLSYISCDRRRYRRPATCVSRWDADVRLDGR